MSAAESYWTVTHAVAVELWLRAGVVVSIGLVSAVRLVGGAVCVVRLGLRLSSVVGMADLMRVVLTGEPTLASVLIPLGMSELLGDNASGGSRQKETGNEMHDG